jgi:hypothetical protein
MRRADADRRNFSLPVALATVARRGAVAQLGERLNGIEEVIGSIPFSSTKFSKTQLKTAAERPPILFSVHHRKALALGSRGEAIIETHERESRGPALGSRNTRRKLQRIGSS